MSCSRKNTGPPFSKKTPKDDIQRWIEDWYARARPKADADSGMATEDFLYASDDVLVFEDYEDDDPPLHADEVHKNFQVELQPPDRPDALYLFTLVDVDDELEPMGEVRTGYLFPDGRIDGLY